MSHALIYRVCNNSECEWSLCCHRNWDRVARHQRTTRAEVDFFEQLRRQCRVLRREKGEVRQVDDGRADMIMRVNNIATVIRTSPVDFS